jgi:DnaJ-class molecular chaperone
MNQEAFEFFKNTHNILLLNSEWEDIKNLVKRVEACACGDGSGWRDPSACADCNDDLKKPKPDKCPECDGNGFTPEHNPDGYHENGECMGDCPIQVQCEKCNGTGNKQ